MPMTISVTAVTATTATFAFGNLAADGTIDLQISIDPDFSFCVCPILSVARGAGITISGLNQRSTLFARCRGRLASGVVEPDWSAIETFRTSDGAARDVSPATVMIEPALFVVPERPTQWIAGNAVAGFPAQNVSVDSPTGWKSIDSVNGVDPDFSFIDVKLSGAPVDTIAALNTNMPESGTVFISAAPSRAALDSGVGRVISNNGGAFRASANLPGRPGYHGLFRFAPVSLPWWRVVFRGTKTASTTWVEHLVFGANRTTKNHSIDKSESPLSKLTIERQRSGVPDRQSGIPMRKVEFDISMMTEAQYEQCYADLHRYEGKPVLVVPNTKTGAFLHDRILFGDLKAGRSFNPVSPRFTKSFIIESLI